MKKVILFTLSVLCVLMLLSGCGGSSKLIGVWEEVDGDGILYFAEDNNGLSANVVYTSESFEYEEKDDTLTFIAESRVETKYAVDDKILTITADDTKYRYKLVELSESEIEAYLADHGIDISVLPDGGNGSKEESFDDSRPDLDTSKGDTPEKGDTPGTMTDKEIAESIVGAWRGGDDSITMVYIFYEDGTGIAGFFPFTYSVKDGVISMTIEAFGEVASGSGKYEVSGDSLTVVDADGETHVLQRVDMPENLPEISFPDRSN